MDTPPGNSTPSAPRERAAEGDDGAWEFVIDHQRQPTRLLCLQIESGYADDVRAKRLEDRADVEVSTLFNPEIDEANLDVVAKSLAQRGG